MTDTINDVAAKKQQEPVVPVLDEQSVAEQLVAQARAKGIDLVGPGGLLNQLTKGCSRRRSRRRCRSIWATTSTIRSGGTTATPAMVCGRRRC